MSYAEQTCNNTVIPAFSTNIITGEYWYARNAINPSDSLPYGVAVSCPVGNPNNISACAYNSGCQIGYEWNSTTYSCQLITGSCSKGYEWSYVTSSCKFIEDPNDSTYGPIYQSTLITSIALAVTGTGILIGFGIALITRTWAQDSLTIIHFLQLVLILPLISKAMSDKVKEFIASNAFTAL